MIHQTVKINKMKKIQKEKKKNQKLKILLPLLEMAYGHQVSKPKTLLKIQQTL